MPLIPADPLRTSDPPDRFPSPPWAAVAAGSREVMRHA